MNEAYLKDERPDRHCVERASRIWLKLGQAPDVGTSLTQTPTSSNPPNSDQQQKSGCLRAVRAWSSQNSVKFVSGRVHSRQRSDNGLGRTSITKGHQGVIHRLLTILEGYVCPKETSNCLRFDFLAQPERWNSVMMVNRGHG